MLQNFSKLLSTNIVSGVLGLVSLTLISRGLGPSVYGLVAIVISLGAFIEQIASFQAWQATTKYAASALVKNDMPKLWRAVSIGLGLDIVGSILASIIGFVVIIVFSDNLGISDNVKTASIIYMLSLSLNVSGTATSVFRIFEEYNLISIVLLTFSAIKLIGVAVLYFTFFSFNSVIVVLMVVQSAQSLTFVYLLLRICRQKGGMISKVNYASLHEFPGITRFLISTNLSSTIRQLVNEFDVILLAAMAGASTAGQYKLAKQYGSMVLRVVEPAQQVAFPKIAALVSSSESQSLSHLIKLLGSIGFAVASSMLLVYWAIGREVVLFLLGTEYNLVADFLGAYLVAIAIFTALFFMGPLVLSLGRADAILGIYTIGTACFFLTYWALFNPFGEISMMYAQIVFYFVWAVGMLWTAWKAWHFKTTT